MAIVQFGHYSTTYLIIVREVKTYILAEVQTGDLSTKIKLGNHQVRSAVIQCLLHTDEVSVHCTRTAWTEFHGEVVSYLALFCLST
jgi:hypothetical protein